MSIVHRRGSMVRRSRITYVGHANWPVRTAGVNLLLDTVWSQRASPFRRFGAKAGE
jgi:hypothetical protein